MKDFWALTRAWAVSLRRDRTALFWSFAFPLIFIVIFGIAFKNTNPTYDVGLVLPQQQDPTAAAFVQGLQHVGSFKLHEGSESAELAALKDGKRSVVAVVRPPANASASPAPSGVAIDVYLDPAQLQATQVVMPILRAVADRVDRQVTGTQPLVRIEERSVRAQNLKYIDFFLPGMVAFSVMQGGLWMAVVFIQLREGRVLKRFGATPVSRPVVVGSQTLVRLVVSIIQSAVLVLAGRFMFNAHIGGNPLVLAALIVLGGLLFLLLGAAISGLAKTEEAAVPIVNVVAMPMMFLSGVFWPVATFPSFIQPLIRVLPLTYFGDAVRQLMTSGTRIAPLWADMAVMAAWVVVAALLAVRFFRWE